MSNEDIIICGANVKDNIYNELTVAERSGSGSGAKVSRMLLALNSLKLSAQSPPWRRNARPRAASPRRSSRLRASPAITIGRKFSIVWSTDSKSSLIPHQKIIMIGHESRGKIKLETSEIEIGIIRTPISANL
ncbi:hypothetical protein M5K25_008051 [Dendrobium thyrsiflorum]|uniref:Uncharacterized protein n=1 Tax=Dendrobium thyrsiflorum TaxID=117978 RepID=A0ABD0V7S9_DENTH